jgi:hypothetical protein
MRRNAGRCTGHWRELIFAGETEVFAAYRWRVVQEFDGLADFQPRSPAGMGFRMKVPQFVVR